MRCLEALELVSCIKGFSLTGCEGCCSLWIRDWNRFGRAALLILQLYCVLFPYLISTLYSFPRASGSLTRVTTLHLFLRSQRTEPYTFIPQWFNSFVMRFHWLIRPLPFHQSVVQDSRAISFYWATCCNEQFRGAIRYGNTSSM